MREANKVLARKSERSEDATEYGSNQPARVQRAAECSPGRKPGVRIASDDLSPLRGDRDLNTEFCRPLRGLAEILSYLNPGLTPGATLCRHLRWLVEQSLPRRTKLRPPFLFPFLRFPLSFPSLYANDR